MMKRFIYLICFILLISWVAAYSGNSTDYVLWKAQEGSLAHYSNASNYRISVGAYAQLVGNYTNSYILCEGYHCLQRFTTAYMPSGGGGGGISCDKGYTLVYLDNKLVCIPTEQYEKVQAGIPLKRSYSLYILLIFVFLFIIFWRRRKKRKEIIKTEIEIR